MIDTLFALPPNRSCLKSISRLGCFLRISENEEIRILHPSFHNYLSEQCSGEHWSIDLELNNKALALCCINLLDKELRQNICDMTLPHLTQKETLPEAISYACKFWIEHMCLISDATDDIVERTYNFWSSICYIGWRPWHYCNAMTIRFDQCKILLSGYGFVIQFA